MTDRDSLGISVEFKDDKLSSIINPEGATFLRHQMLGMASAFHSVRQGDGGMTSFHFQYGGLVGASDCEDAFEYLPRVFFDLLVTQAHSPVFLVKLKDDHFNFITHIAKLRWVLDLFRPAQIRDVDQSINSLFKLHKQTKVGEVANCTFLLGFNGIAAFNVFPGIHSQLLQSQRHLALLSVNSENHTFDFIVDV